MGCVCVLPYPVEIQLLFHQGPQHEILRLLRRRQGGIQVVQVAQGDELLGDQGRIAHREDYILVRGRARPRPASVELNVGHLALGRLRGAPRTAAVWTTGETKPGFQLGHERGPIIRLARIIASVKRQERVRGVRG